MIKNLYTLVILPILFSCSPLFGVVLDRAGSLQDMTNFVSGDRYSGVGQLYVNGSSCTATVIADRAILTAAHCTQYSNSGYLYLRFSDRPSVYIRVVAFVDHPGWVDSPNRSRPRGEFTNDISIGILEYDLPTFVPRYKIANYPDLSAGQTTRIIGYGGSAKYTYTNLKAGYLNYGLNEVTGFYNNNKNFYISFNESGLLSCNKQCILSGAGVTYDKRYGIYEAVTASGDSGGPVFTSPYLDAVWSPELPLTVFQKMTSDTPEIIGVTSHGQSTYCNGGICYGATAGFVNVLMFTDWISSVFNNYFLSGASLISNTDFSYGPARPQEDIAPTFNFANVPEESKYKEYSQAADFKASYILDKGSIFLVDNSTSFKGNSSLTSAVIADGESSQIEAFIDGPATLSFTWKVSSEEGYDELILYVDEQIVESISGDKDWRTIKIYLEEGTHLIKWEYLKDDSISFGLDRGWIDNISLNPTNLLTRREMVKEILNALRITPSPATGTIYYDVDLVDPDLDWIEEFHNRGFTEGCDINKFCPNNIVTRAEMAKFFLKTLNVDNPSYLPPINISGFTDVVPGDFNEYWVAELANLSFTEGCDFNKFCPKEPVTRLWFDTLLTKY